MQKLTKKQYLKSQTFNILHEILQGLLPEEEQSKVTSSGVYKQFPKASYYKSQDTGMIKVGLSFKGVRKLVKNNPYISVTEVKKYFNL